MRQVFACVLTLLVSPYLFADDLTTPPFFKEGARATVDNAKGATLTIPKEIAKAGGASLTIPPGALTNDKEDVVFSYSNKMPGLPEKPRNFLAFVQNSQIYAVQTSSGKLSKAVTISLPYYNEQDITAAGARVVMFHYWNLTKSTFETLDAKPVPARISYAEIKTDKIYPQVEYVSLRLTQSPSRGTKPLAPPGYKIVPDADACLKVDGPKLISAPDSLEQQYEAAFSNKCDYPIQASGCENKEHTQGCTLPKAVDMPAHSTNLLTLSGFSTKDLANIGACRASLADGTPVTYHLELSSKPHNNTVCLIKEN